MTEQIIAILRKYRVQKHYRASSAAKVTRYAVYHAGQQLTDPKTYRDAHDDADALTARDILTLVASGEIGPPNIGADCEKVAQSATAVRDPFAPARAPEDRHEP